MNASGRTQSRHARESASKTSVYIEEISVPFSYPVYFTRRAFDPANPVVAEAIGGKTAGKTLAYLDSGLVEAHPYLPDAIVAYAERHAKAMELLAEPRVLPGGELPAQLRAGRRRRCLP